jgi:hypothetical protein
MKFTPAHEHYPPVRDIGGGGFDRVIVHHKTDGPKVTSRIDAQTACTNWPAVWSPNPWPTPTPQQPPAGRVTVYSKQSGAVVMAAADARKLVETNPSEWSYQQ